MALFFMTSTSQNQPKNIQELETDYNQFFVNSREAVFIHLHKTKLLPNENLWFAAYLYDLKKNLPAITSTNLNVQLFDNTGKQITSKTFYSYQGKSTGSLDINSLNLSPGTYFIKASTSYIRNQDDKLSGLRPFEILGETSEIPTNYQDQDFDLQLLPEGGHIVLGVNNTIGVKLSSSSGEGIGELPGYVLRHNDTISRFNTNKFGMASFTFHPELNKNYKVLLETEKGKFEEQKLTDFDLTGVTMTIKDFNQDILISVKTNLDTQKEISNKKFFAAIHQEGKIKDFSFYFPEKLNEANITFPKDSLFNGVNTVTIFDDSFKPLLERLIFKKPEKSINFKISATKNFGDSLKIRLSGNNSKENIGFLSIATFPSKTKAYDKNISIVSEFLLKPYIQGNIQNPSYYFSENQSERRRMYDLDLLLLTQGWSKYKWDNIFANNNRNATEIRQQGFSIKGSVFDRNIKKENELFLKNELSGEFGIISIKDNNSFEVPNLFIEDSTKFSVGLLNDRNSKLSKPSVKFKVYPEVLNSTLDTDSLNNKFFTKKRTIINIPENFVSASQVLDTVTINARKKEEKQDIKSGNRLSALAEEIIIDENDERAYLYITDLIARKGFMVRRTPAGVEIRSRIPFSLNGPPPAPNIYLNGARILGDLNILYSITTDQVESLYINTSASAGRGLSSGGGVIEINLKKGANTGRSNNRNSINSIISNNGYELQKTYYNPKYNSYSTKLFQEYGSIDWKPQVLMDAAFTDLMVLNTLQKNIKLYIEGFTLSGELISETIEIDMN